MLKRIPITYKGELHEVVLVNFSVDIEEVRPHVPKQLKIRDFGGRALISMVNVNLKRMRPTFIPSPLHFTYRHVAFRLLVDDSEYNGGDQKGIYFYQSFTSNPLIVLGGNLLTNYKLTRAEVWNHSNGLDVKKGDHYLSYELEPQAVIKRPNHKLKNIVGAIDRAYAMFGTQVRVTQIMRKKWPLEEIKCTKFHNTFFQSAKLEGVFRVPETIYYTWLPPKKATYNISTQQMFEHIMQPVLSTSGNIDKPQEIKGTLINR